ncbi:MAG: hypothetical protein LBC14_08040 [Desulfovibrio sp.]|jgi:hypothetical protein|nr:hypothetical protein [Desulfovibrio sp.]
MRKIAAYYLHNVGFRHLWFMRHYVPCFSPVGNAPVHTIIGAGNGSGKSTAIALLFSLLVPGRNQFLRTQKDPNYAFEDYFDDCYFRPGFVVIEFDAGAKERSLLQGERKRIIVGQAVCLSQSGNDHMYRRFFSFRAAAGFGMKTLLEGRGEIASLESLADQAQFKEWLKAMRAAAPKDHPASFYDTDNQQEWLLHLSGTWGIDTTLSQLQWRYNKREGGVEVKEENSFADHQDFLRRFMRMCLNESAASALQKNIESNIKNLNDVPRFEAQLAVFRSMQEHFEPFRSAVLKLREAERSRDNELREARGLAVALARQAGIFQERCALHRKNVALLQANAATAEAGRHDAEARLRGLEKARHEAVMRERHKAHEAAQASADKALHTLEIRKARRDLTEIDKYTAEIAENERQLELADAEVKVFRDRAAKAGAEYKSALNMHRTVLATAEARNERLVRRLEKAKSILTERTRERNRERDAHTENLARIGAHQEQAAKRLERLIAQGIVRQGEDGLAATKRMRNEAATLQENLQSASAAVTETEQRIKALQTEAAAKDKEREGFERQADEKGREYARGRDMAGELLARLFESGLVDTPEADLESPLVERNLGERRDLLEEKNAELTIKKGTLQNDRTCVERFGVLGVDHNVTAVTRALIDAGIGAMPYGSYLAEVLADRPETARAVYLSDPARFSGVQVLDRAGLDAAGALTGLSLDRPVVVSPAADTPAAPAADCVVVGHEGHALYNKAAAKAFSEQLDERIADLERLQSNARRETQTITDRLSRLSAYIHEFGSGKLKAIKSCEEQLRERAGDLGQWLKDAEKTRAALEAGLAEQRKSRETLVSRVSALQTASARVQEYVEDFESKALQWEREKEVLDLKLEAVNARLSTLQRCFIKAGDSCSRHRDKAADLQHRIEFIKYLLSQVLVYSSEQFDVGTEYEPLGKIYESAYAALKDKEDGKAGDLSKTLKTLRTEQQKRLKDYNEHYGTFDEAAIRAVPVEGLETQIRTAGKTLEQTRQAVSEAKSSLDAAAGAYRHDMERWAREGLEVAEAKLDESIRRDEIEKLIFAVKEEIDVAGKIMAEAARDAKSEAALAAEADEHRACFDNAGKRVDDAIAQFADSEDIAAAEVAAPASDMAESVAASRRKSLSRCIRTLQESEELLRQKHAALMLFLESAAVRAAAPYESALMLEAGRGNTEDFAADAEDKARIIADRVKMLEDNIAKSEEGLRICAKALAGGVEHGLRLLKSAVNFRVPETVPALGGQQVLKVGGLDKLGKAPIPLEEYLKSFIKRLVGAGVIPGGDRLVADALCYAADSMDVKLGVRILKPVPALGRYEHVDISSYSSSSGGEGLTSALMYYLLAAYIRGREQGRDVDFGGVLILDNPIGEANLAVLLQAQREIAAGLGIQLLYFTGIKDMESMNEFDHHVTLRASQKEDRRSGRRYMEIWSTEVQP